MIDWLEGGAMEGHDKNYLHGYTSSTAQSRNIPGMTGMLYCGTKTIINGMV